MAVSTDAMGNLTDCTAMRGDRAALQGIMDEQGHWLFRGVLDLRPVAAVRQAFLSVLERLGVIEAGDETATWNGADLTHFPGRMEALHEGRHWRAFVGHPAIHGFFADLLGEPPYWVPSIEYRITPPSVASPADLLSGRHQDGFFNEGFDFLTCWIPLNAIDAPMGGLALAPGLHRQGYFHDADAPPFFRMPPGAIGDAAWCRSDTGPGDLIMFGPMTPHSGMLNMSDRFRLSMDLRVAPAGGRLPIVGTLLEVGPDHAVIANRDGRDIRLVLDDATFCRRQDGARIDRAQMIRMVAGGDGVMASRDGNRATLFRLHR